MIKLENYEVVGWEHAIRGMRNPKNSWGRSDSDFHARRDLRYCDNDVVCFYDEDGAPHLYDGVEIGPNDHTLMMSLAKGGPVHAKYRRFIDVYVDITAPLYWWKEFDTYKVGTAANSCSTMHKIADKRFEMSDFSYEHLLPMSAHHLEMTIKALNKCRDLYLGFDGFKHEFGEADKKEYWWQMIQLLPSSYNQKRTVKLNYEVLTGIYTWRKDHKLDEWREFCKWIEKLPYSEIITGVDMNDADNIGKGESDG